MAPLVGPCVTSNGESSSACIGWGLTASRQTAILANPKRSSTAGTDRTSPLGNMLDCAEKGPSRFWIVPKSSPSFCDRIAQAYRTEGIAVPSALAA